MAETTEKRFFYQQKSRTIRNTFLCKLHSIYIWIKNQRGHESLNLNVHDDVFYGVGSLEMCKNSKRFLIQTVLNLRLRRCKNLPKEIESCHGWISPVIVEHISWVCELHSETVGKWGEGIEKGNEIHFIAPQAHLPSPWENLSKASAQTLHQWLTGTFGNISLAGSSTPKSIPFQRENEQLEGFSVCSAESGLLNYEIHEFQAIFWNRGCFCKCSEIEIFAEPWNVLKITQTFEIPLIGYG